MDTPDTLLEAVAYFADLDRCVAYLVSRRWPNGVTCPTCGNSHVRFDRKRRVWTCNTKHPKRQFSVKVGTIFEDSPLGLDKWLPAVWLIAGAKNGISSYELGRALGVTQKSAWFMLHRIRLAMHGKPGPFSGHVEADETFIGGKARNMHRDKAKSLGFRRGGRPRAGKVAVFGLLERTTAERNSRVKMTVVPNVRRGNVLLEVKKGVQRGSTVHTDALRSYQWPTSWGPSAFVHNVIDHAEKYVDGIVHTNGMENFFGSPLRAHCADVAFS